MNNPLRSFCDSHTERTDIRFCVPDVYMDPGRYTGYLFTLDELPVLRDAIYDENTLEAMVAETKYQEEYNFPPNIALLTTPDEYIICTDNWGAWNETRARTDEPEIPILIHSWRIGNRSVSVASTRFLASQILRVAIALSDYTSTNKPIPFLEGAKRELIGNQDGSASASFLFPIGSSWIDVYTTDADSLINLIGGDILNFRKLLEADDKRLEVAVLRALRPETEDVDWYNE